MSDDWHGWQTWYPKMSGGHQECWLIARRHVIMALRCGRPMTHPGLWLKCLTLLSVTGFLSLGLCISMNPFLVYFTLSMWREDITSRFPCVSLSYQWTSLNNQACWELRIHARHKRMYINQQHDVYCGSAQEVGLPSRTADFRLVSPPSDTVIQFKFTYMITATRCQGRKSKCFLEFAELQLGGRLFLKTAIDMIVCSRRSRCSISGQWDT